MAKIAVGVTRGMLLAYPFIVYGGLTYFEPRYMGLGLLFIVIIQYLHGKEIGQETKSPYVVAVLIMGTICAVSVLALNHDFLLRLYPFLINLSLLLVFSVSLIKPSSIIERIARATHPNLSDQGFVYARNLTKVWCGFFVVNGGISLYTALFAPIKIWTLYNGLIAYIAMGTLFLTDSLYRSVKKYHE